MKKVLSYTLITFVILANLFAPVSVVFEKGTKIEIQKNNASAEEKWDGTDVGFKNAFPKSGISTNGSMTSTADISTARITLTVDTGIEENITSEQRWFHVDTEVSNFWANITEGLTFYAVSANETLRQFKNYDAFVLKVVEKGTNKTGFVDVTQKLIGNYIYKRIVPDGEERMVNKITQPITLNTITPAKENGLSFLKGGTTYDLTLYYLGIANMKWGESIPGLEENGKNYYPIANTLITTATKEQQVIDTGIVDDATVVSGGVSSSMPACSIIGNSSFFGTKGTFMGCVAQTFYYVLFVPTSYLFALAGVMFDYTFSYSVQDSSYSSTFVIQGWKLVRDFCNLFFIFIMLYVAIGTILNLQSVKTKETIINIIIIGLFINFSLFATQVIIDASNITARVFYNSDSIKLSQEEKSGSSNLVDAPADNGVISLSAALVAKINPQNIIINSNKVNDVPNQVDNASVKDTTKDGKDSLDAGQFILIILIVSAINMVGFVVFLTVAMLFVARVIGLWLAMILSPLAFFTYIIPSLSDIKMIGWKKWWPDTLKIAFLAPVFIFFMYLILKFLELDLISDASGRSGLDFFVSVLIPFLFIMIFMMKAKKIAIDMAGEFGEMAVKAGNMVGGVALGAAGGVALGGLAKLGRSTLGNMGEWAANSKFAKTNGAFGRGVGNLGKWASTKSFDARNTKAWTEGTKQLGMQPIDNPLTGSAKEGGYAKHREDKVKKRVARAKELEVSEDDGLKQTLNKTELDLQQLLNANKDEMDAINKKIEKARQNLKDANDSNNRQDQDVYSSQLQVYKKQLDALEKGKDFTGNQADMYDYDNSGNLVIANVGKNYETNTLSGVAGGLTINQLKDNQRDQKNNIENENRRRKTTYANSKAKWGGRANREAEHKIIMEEKIES